MVAPKNVPVDRPAIQSRAIGQFHAGNRPSGKPKRNRFALDHSHARFIHELGHCLPIENAVGLDTRTTHGAALAGIQHPAMDGRAIGGPSHDSAHRVHFPDQVPLADTANGRIAGHLPEVVRAKGQ